MEIWAKLNTIECYELRCYWRALFIMFNGGWRDVELSSASPALFLSFLIFLFRLVLFFECGGGWAPFCWPLPMYGLHLAMQQYHLLIVKTCRWMDGCAAIDPLRLTQWISPGAAHPCGQLHIASRSWSLHQPIRPEQTLFFFFFLFFFSFLPPDPVLTSNGIQGIRP